MVYFGPSDNYALHREGEEGEPDRQLRGERLSLLKLLTEVHCNAKLLSVQLACKKFGSSLVNI